MRKVLLSTGIIVVLSLVITGIYILFNNKTPVVKKEDSNTYQRILAEVLQKKKPLVVFVYGNKNDQNALHELAERPAVKDKLSQCLSKTVKTSMVKQQYSDLFTATETGVLFLNFKGERIDFTSGIPVDTALISLIDKLLDNHNKLIAREKSAGKEFLKARSVYQTKKYILAMEQLRKFLMVYGDSEYAREARSLLQQCSETPDVTEYLNQNRDKTNRKVLFNEAEENFSYHRFFQAEKAVTMIITSYPGTEEAQKAQEIKKKIEEYGREKYKEANKLYQQKRFDEAKEAFLSLHEQFKGTNWDLFISGKITQIEGDPEYAKYKKQVKINREAKTTFKKAEKQFAAKNWQIAQAFYAEIVKFYPQSEYVETAKKRIKEIDDLRYNELYGPKENESENKLEKKTEE